MPPMQPGLFLLPDMLDGLLAITIDASRRPVLRTNTHSSKGKRSKLTALFNALPFFPLSTHELLPQKKEISKRSFF